MNSTQLRKSVWSRLLRGPSRPPRAKGRTRLAVKALEDRCLLAQLGFVTQPLPTNLGDFLNLARPPARAERGGAPEMGCGPRTLRSGDRPRLRRSASLPLLKKPKTAWRDFAPDFALKTRTTTATAK